MIHTIPSYPPPPPPAQTSDVAGGPIPGGPSGGYQGGRGEPRGDGYLQKDEHGFHAGCVEAMCGQLPAVLYHLGRGISAWLSVFQFHAGLQRTKEPAQMCGQLPAIWFFAVGFGDMRTLNGFVWAT